MLPLPDASVQLYTGMEEFWRSRSWQVTSLLVLLVALAMAVLGPGSVLSAWGIRRTDPPFMDSRTIAAAAESRRDGFDPMIENPRRENGTVMNYPRVWQWLDATGLDKEHAWVLGWIFGLMLAAAVLLLPVGGMGGRETALVLAGVFSPAVMLGLERGNNDLCAFFLLVLGARLICRGKGWDLGGAGVLVMAVILKLFPLFGFAGMAVLPRRRLVICGGIATVLVAGYLALTWSDLSLISAGTPRATGVSYGRSVVPMAAAGHSAALGSVLAMLSLLGVGIAVILGCLGLRGAQADSTDPAKRTAFLAGAGVYLGTFLLGNNWDYRLVFLLLTLPQLVRWAVHGVSKIERVTSAVVLAAMLLSFWHIVLYQGLALLPFGSPAAGLLDEAANWVVFLGLAWLAGRAVPEEIWRGIPWLGSR